MSTFTVKLLKKVEFDFTNLYTAWPTGASSMDITFGLRGYKIFGRMG